MLCMVQMRHDAAHCPGYHRELLPPLMEAIERRDEIAKQAGVKLRGLWNALPEHVEFALVEAENPTQVARFISQLWPVEQAEIKVTPVATVEDLLALARQMTAG